MTRRMLQTLLLILLIFAGATGAVKLRKYENQVRRAVEQIERIKTDPSEYGDQGLETIRTLMPESEELEIEGRAKPFVVDNTWLYLKLDSYEEEDDPQQKLAKLNEIGGMLSALGDHLLRIEETSASKMDSADSREKIKQILNRPDYQARKESRLGAFLKSSWETVSNFLSELYQAFMRMLNRLFGTSSSGSWISIVLIIALAFAAFLVAMRIARQIKPRRRRSKKRTVLGEEIEAGTSPQDLAEAAMAAARAGDFRTGMRKLYLSLLYDLAERRLIELEENATNHEYLLRVARFTSLVPAMRYLTDQFDYFWYGMLPSTEKDFSAYLARYREALERAEGLSQHAA
jgi:hypothetical protein